MRLRLARIRGDRARLQQILDAAQDFAEPFQPLSGTPRAFMESAGSSLGAVPGLSPVWSEGFSGLFRAHNRSAVAHSE